jgi:hypothetical protein
MSRIMKGVAVAFALLGCSDVTAPNSFQLRSDKPSYTANGYYATRVGLDGWYTCVFPVILIGEGGTTKDIGILQVANDSQSFFGHSNATLKTWFASDEIRSGSKLSGTIQLDNLRTKPWSRTIEIFYLDPRANYKSFSFSLTCQ